MNQFNWDSFDVNEQAYHFARFMSDIWRAHAFREGNTRTTITFLSQFAKYRGFPLDTILFVKRAGYIRNALVASVFEDEIWGKKRNYKYMGMDPLFHFLMKQDPSPRFNYFS